MLWDAKISGIGAYMQAVDQALAGGEGIAVLRVALARGIVDTHGTYSDVFPTVQLGERLAFALGVAHSNGEVLLDDLRALVARGGKETE